MLDDIYDDLKSTFTDAEERLQRELTKVRTGRANPAVLDSVMVDYYGQPTPIAQAATIKVPEPRMITVTPWDASLIGDIERAINLAGIGLNPNNDGTTIRLPIPSLTKERRQELAKQARQTAEESRITIRNGRRDANDMLKSLEKDKDISEDEMHRAMEKVQELTDAAIKRVDSVLEDKEKEIIEV